MIIGDVGPVYIKLGILLNKNNTKFQYDCIFQSFSDYKYIKKENIIEIGNCLLFPVSLNSYHNEFIGSKEYCFFLEFMKVENISTINVTCKLTKEVEQSLKKYFPCILNYVRIDNINSTELLVIAINTLTLIQTNLFEIPGQELRNLYKIGHELILPSKKYISLKSESLYPFLLANVKEGLSLYRVDSQEKYYRVGGH